MPPEEVVALAWRQREALRSLANRLGEDFDDQFAPAVQRRPLSARKSEASRGRLGRRRRDARRPAREDRQAGREETRPARRQTARRERVLALRADRDERGSPARADRLRGLRNRARSRPEAPMRQRPQPPRTRPRRNVSPGHGDQAHLLRRALPLRSGQRRNAPASGCARISRAAGETCS